MRSNRTPVIRAQGLSKRYGEMLALDGFDFTAEFGQVAGIVGPNGAGKSTALRCLMGTTIPTTGTVSVFGRDIFELDNPAGQIGLVLDPPGLEAGMSAERHLRIVATAGGIPVDRIPSVLSECGIRELRRKRIGSLSTGQRQRLAIATALLGSPRLLVLDEPQNGLDAEGIIWLRELVSAHAEAGGAVVLCTHLLTEMELVADTITVLQVRPVFQGSLNELTQGGASTLEDRYSALTSVRPLSSSPRSRAGQ